MSTTAHIHTLKGMQRDKAAVASKELRETGALIFDKANVRNLTLAAFPRGRPIDDSYFPESDSQCSNAGLRSSLDICLGHLP
jgi:hypothetical protein